MATITGSISAIGKIENELSKAGVLSGTIKPIGKIVGSLSKSEDSIEGSISGRVKIDGSITLPVSVDYEQYSGEYVVTPHSHESVVLDTNSKLMLDDVTVLKVPYWETSNEKGKTVYIGLEV